MLRKEYLPHMSDLPASPAAPFGPSVPLVPSLPGSPTHTKCIHKNIRMMSGLVYKPKDYIYMYYYFASMDN